MKKNMKKNMPVICNLLSVVLLTAFLVKSIADYGKYSPVENSAPFSTWLLANALYFIIPAIVVFILGMMIKKKL